MTAPWTKIHHATQECRETCWTCGTDTTIDEAHFRVVGADEDRDRAFLEKRFIPPRNRTLFRAQGWRLGVFCSSECTRKVVTDETLL
jgi:hypothetical protein